MSNFDINYPNEDSLTFLQKLLMEGDVDINKMQAILQTKPKITELHIEELDAKLKLNWVTYHKPAVKKAMSAIREYVANK